MSERLGEIAAAIRAFADSFDPALLLGSEASRAVMLACTIKNIASSIEARAAARADDCGAWAREGDRSPAHTFARKTGTTVGQAAAAMDTARKLEELPDTKRAATEGKLSAQQTEAIASAATADPSSEQKLLEAAPKLSLKELRDEADRVKAAADRDAEARRKRIHRERSLRSWIDAQGAGNLLWRDNPERVAQVMAVLQGVADKKFEEARKEERHESPGAYLADALVDVVAGGSEAEGAPRSTGTRRPGPPKVIVRVDLDALLRGVVEEGETCELVGYGPIAVSAVEEMIGSGAIVCAVGTKAC
ncbi:MAG: DUF222 domain-containing protein, partial [Actinobacteria bacterium]|nr:DUF222 domain-containing protein [Actinomycetota bacterium]